MKSQKFYFLTLGIFLLWVKGIAQNRSQVGEWSSGVPFGIVPVAVANLPDGRLITWSSQFRNTFISEGDGSTFTELFDPFQGPNGRALGEFTTNTNHDMFCPGINNLADGRILSAGGTSSAKTSIYDWQTGLWSVADEMNIPRGYQGNVTLSDGSVFTVGGSWSGGPWTNRDAEIWMDDAGWRILSNIKGDDFYTANDAAGDSFQTLYRADNHIWLWPAPDGNLFHAGPSELMHWINTSGNGTMVSAGFRSNDGFSMKGTTVMFDVGKILKVGGAESYDDRDPANNNSYVIDINGGFGSTPSVTPTNNRLQFSRTMHNSTVLPNGEVLITGGLSESLVFTDGGARLTAEIFNPTTNSWRSVAGMSTPRTYHSVAILMVDGRVFVGGGGLCPTPPQSGCVDHFDAEIYSPPYLFNGSGILATRPVISAPVAAGYNSTIAVNGSSGIQQFSLIRFSAATHSTNNEQRRIPLSYIANGGNYQVSIPNQNLLPPGYYMLFALDANGVPSVAEIIQIGEGLGNIPPVAIATANVQSGGAPLTVNFSSSASSDDTGITLYNWNFGDGNSNSNANPTHTYTVPGNYTTILTVTDGNGVSDSDAIAINVNTGGPIEDCPDGLSNENNAIPVVQGGAFQGLDSFVANETETNGSRCSLEITNNDAGQLFANYRINIDLAFRGIAIGDELFISLDGNNGTGVARMEVNRNNSPNTAVAAHTYSGSGWSTYSETFTVPAGTNTLNIWLYSNYLSGSGGTAYYDNLTLTNLSNPGNIPPTAVATSDIEEGSAPLTVRFTGSASTDDLGIVSYAWNFGDGTTSDEADPEHIYTTEGSYTATLTVIDEDGATDSAAVDIAVDPEPIFRPFITTWKTDNPGSSAANQLTIPIYGDQSYDYTVDWGDGTISENVSESITHTYDAASTYTVSISGDFPGINFNNGGDKEKLLSIDQWGDVVWLDMSNAYYGCSNMDMLATDVPSLDINTNSFFQTFRDCTSLVGNSSMAQWDVGNIFSTAYMFAGATSFNQDISDWGFGTIFSMDSMFEGAVSYNQPVDFDGFGRTPTMINMFNGATSFDQDLSLMPRAGSDMTGMLVNSGLSDENYDNTLIGWSTQLVLNDVVFDAPQNQYCQSGEARQLLIDTFGWTINDAGELEGCVIIEEPCIDGLPNEDDAIVVVQGGAFQGLDSFVANETETNGSPCALSITNNDAGQLFANYRINIDLAFRGIAIGDELFISLDGNNGTGVARMEVNRNNSPNSAVAAHTYSGSGWSTYSETFTVPAGTNTLDIWLYSNYLSGSGGTAYYDNLILTNLSAGGNIPPTAVATSDVEEGSAPLTVRFTGSASTDDLGIVSYAWNFDDGTTSDEADPEHIYTTEGSYTATLTVTDGNSETDSANILISVSAPSENQPPVAIATSDVETGSAPLTVNFTGSNSTDDIEVVSYSWDFGDGTTSVEADPQHVYTNSGTYTATLTVSDADLATSSDGLIITVTDEVPPESCQDGLFNEDGTIVLVQGGAFQGLDSFAGTDTETNGSPCALSITNVDSGQLFANYRINIDLAAQGISVGDELFVSLDGNNGSGIARMEVNRNNSPNSAVAAHTYLGSGWSTYSETFIVPAGTNTLDIWLYSNYLSNSGGTVYYDNLTVTNLSAGGNRPPSALAVSNVQSGNAPLTVSFTGSGSTDDLGIVSYDWDFGDGTNSSSADPQHVYTEAGSYIAVLTVTDGDGASGSDSITINVIPEGGNQPPVAVATSNVNSGIAPLTVNFNGGGSTDDIGIVSYNWNFGDGNSSTSINPTHTYSVEGDYVATLTVTDGNSASDSDSITINVSSGGSGNPGPIVNDNDLVVHLNFEESSGVFVSDDSGFNNNFTIIERDDFGNQVTANDHTWSANGVYGNALEMDGEFHTSNSILQLPYNSNIDDIANQMTITTWVWRDPESIIPQTGLAANVSLLSHDYPAIFTGFHNWLIKYSIITTNGVSFCYGGHAPLNQWVHYAMTYDGQTVRLYSNGIEICNQPITGQIRLRNDSSPNSTFQVSGFYEHRIDLPVVPYGNQSGITDELDGRLDDFRVYRRALSGSDIQSIYQQGLNTGTPGIADCTSPPIVPEYRIGVNGPWVTGNFVNAPIGSQVFIRARNYSGEYIITTSTYDGPTISSVNDTNMLTADGAYQLDTFAIGFGEPGRNDGIFDNLNVGQYALTTTDGCSTVINVVAGSSALKTSLGNLTNVSPADIIITPNPGSSVVQMYLPESIASGKLSLYNTTGQLLETIVDGELSSPIEFFVERYPEGAYLLVLELDNQRISKRLLIDR